MRFQGRGGGEIKEKSQKLPKPSLSRRQGSLAPSHLSTRDLIRATQGKKGRKHQNSLPEKKKKTKKGRRNFPYRNNSSQEGGGGLSFYLPPSPSLSTCRRRRAAMDRKEKRKGPLFFSWGDFSSTFFSSFVRSSSPRTFLSMRKNEEGRKGEGRVKRDS